MPLCFNCFLPLSSSSKERSTTTMAPLTRSSKKQLQLPQQPVDHDFLHTHNKTSSSCGWSNGMSDKRQRVKELAAGGECGMCGKSIDNEGFVASCGHRFCRPCVVEHFSKGIRNQLQDVNPRLEMVSSCSRCPNSSCTEEFRRFELVELVGSKMVRLYEKWLVSVFHRLFAHVDSVPQNDICWNTKCDKQNPSAILSSKLTSLPPSEVRQAAEIRGVEQSKLVRGDNCLQNLLCAVGRPKKEQGKALWLCTTCDHSWCAYCGTLIPLSGTKSDRQNFHTACSGLQRFKMYECMLQLEAACKPYSASDQATPELKPKASKGTKTIWADGTGFGGDSMCRYTDSVQWEAKRKEQSSDYVVAKNLSYLTTVLKEEKNEEGQVSSLFTSTCAILGDGNILNRLLRQLVTNDSMLDISERRLVYISMVDLLKEFADLRHKDLDCILLGCNHYDNSERDELCGPENWTSILEGDESCSVDKDNSVIKKMENIYKQAKVMMQRIKTIDGAAQGDINLAKELCACYESLVESVLKRNHQPTESALEVPTCRTATDKMQEDRIMEQLVIHYKETLQALQFREVEMTDEHGNYKHHFKNLIGGNSCIDKRGVHHQKRMLHMAKEISSLSTTLPLEWESSIHLYVDQNRLDVLRALIIGPSGTPYQNGIFQFDLFLPSDYPQVPPLVQFLTTGGSKVRFNPNLYETGKICLSLLGTWSGPGWIPGKSTLLQVLVSIQSLIFVKEPYYNEPGYERRASPESERESMRHRENTLSLAILAPLIKPDPFFSDLITEHFLHKRAEVYEQCDQWLTLATDAAMKQRMAQTVESIKSALGTLS